MVVCGQIHAPVALSPKKLCRYSYNVRYSRLQSCYGSFTEEKRFSILTVIDLSQLTASQPARYN